MFCFLIVGTYLFLGFLIKSSLIDANWQERFKNVKSAQDKLGEDNNDLKEKLDLLSNAIGDQEKFVQSNGYMSSYADIENMLHPVSMQIDEVS